MTRVGQLKLQSALVCDDIRKEADSNKYIIIGTYGGGLVVRDLPGVLPLAFYLDFDTPPGIHEIEVRISWPQKGSATLKGRIIQERHDTATLVTPKMEIAFEKEGVLRIDARVPKGKWANLLKKNVTRGPSSKASSVGSEQSSTGSENLPFEEPGPAPQRSRVRRRAS